jgi:hypothetical protein
MEKEKLKHIILDLVVVLTVSLFGFAFAIWQNLIGVYIFGGIYAAIFFIRALRWILFLYDRIFDKTVTQKTKGYSSFTRVPIYFHIKRSHIHYYSEISFDDPTLKGKYVYLEDDFSLKHGQLLEVTYYKNSKVIKSIKRL